MAIVTKTLADLPSVSAEDKIRFERLENMREEDIDTSDMPPLTKEQLALAVQARHLRHSQNKPVCGRMRVNREEVLSVGRVEG